VLYPQGERRRPTVDRSARWRVFQIQKARKPCRASRNHGLRPRDVERFASPSKRGGEPNPKKAIEAPEAAAMTAVARELSGFVWAVGVESTGSSPRALCARRRAHAGAEQPASGRPAERRTLGRALRQGFGPDSRDKSEAAPDGSRP